MIWACFRENWVYKFGHRARLPIFYLGWLHGFHCVWHVRARMRVGILKKRRILRPKNTESGREQDTIILNHRYTVFLRRLYVLCSVKFIRCTLSWCFFFKCESLTWDCGSILVSLLAFIWKNIIWLNNVPFWGQNRQHSMYGNLPTVQCSCILQSRIIKSSTVAEFIDSTVDIKSTPWVFVPARQATWAGRAGRYTTTLCRSWLSPPVMDLWIRLQQVTGYSVPSGLKDYKLIVLVTPLFVYTDEFEKCRLVSQTPG